MSTTLTNLDQARLEMAVQYALKNVLVPLPAFSFGVSVDGLNEDDVIKVPVLTDPTAQVKTLGTATTDDGAVTGVSVTLDTAKEAAFKLIEGNVQPGQAQAYAEGLAAGAAYSLGKAILDSAFALVTAANYGNTAADKHVSAVADFGQNDLGSLYTKAEAKKLGRNRSLVLNGAYAGALIGESNLGLILATLGDNALKTAVLPPLMGMNTYVYSPLSDNSENLGGMVIDPVSIAIGVSPITNLVNSGDANVIFSSLITEPQSGVTVNYKMVADGDAGYMKGILNVIYGVKKIKNAVIRLVSA